MITNSRIVVRQLSYRCWEVVPAADDDPDRVAHHDTAAEARGYAEELAEEQGISAATVAELPAPCWVADCALCGALMVDVEGYRRVHWSSAESAAEGAHACEDGCDPPPDPSLRVPDGMDALPGMEVA